MARKHRADHRPLHPRRVLTPYAITAIDDGPWPGCLALGPAPAGEHDLAAIARWGAVTVLDLTSPEESVRLGLHGTAGRLAASGIRWIGAPIEDFTAPDAGFERNWPAIRDHILARLAAGDRVLVHCRAGKGRSGTVSAALMIAGGVSPDAAIAAVRRARPGAIETPEQEAWVRRCTVGASAAEPG